MLQEHFEMYTAPEAYLLHAFGAFGILDMLLEHICYIMILEYCAFKCSWSIFDLKYYSRLFMLQQRSPRAYAPVVATSGAWFRAKTLQKLDPGPSN